MCGPSVVLTSIPGTTGTEERTSFSLSTDWIRLWSVTANPTPMHSARRRAATGSVSESEHLVW